MAIQLGSDWICWRLCFPLRVWGVGFFYSWAESLTTLVLPYTARLSEQLLYFVSRRTRSPIGITANPLPLPSVDLPDFLYFNWSKERTGDNREQVFDRKAGLRMSPQMTTLLAMLCLLPLFFWSVRGWTGEIRGRVVCDVCGDSSLGPEDHTLEGAEVAVLCITKSGEVVNYQAFTNSKGVYKVAETMPESERWDGCLARPISSFSEHCSHLGRGTAGVKFSYNHPSGYFHTVRPFIYKPVNAPAYCM